MQPLLYSEVKNAVRWSISGNRIIVNSIKSTSNLFLDSVGKVWQSTTPKEQSEFSETYIGINSIQYLFLRILKGQPQEIKYGLKLMSPNILVSL